MPELENQQSLFPDTRPKQFSRTLSRSPHPYHRARTDLPHATLNPSLTYPFTRSPLSSTRNSAGETSEDYHEQVTRSTESDSGTEADDEHFLKGLPAPRRRVHKGFSAGDGLQSGTTSPLRTPKILKEVIGKGSDYIGKGRTHTDTVTSQQAVWEAADTFRRQRTAELPRRLMEMSLLIAAGTIITSNGDVKVELRKSGRELRSFILIVGTLFVLYPVRLITYAASRKSSYTCPSIRIPPTFDPAPLLYPVILPLLVASLLLPANSSVLLPNIILSISSISPDLIPSFGAGEKAKYHIQWLISCIPLFLSNHPRDLFVPPAFGPSPATSITREDLLLLYPLHGALCTTLHFLTTTSLLPAELQLLSISLINLLMLAESPQAVILKTLLWLGGVGTLVTCSRVLNWVVTLARVPRWRFRREPKSSRPSTLRWWRFSLKLGKAMDVAEGSGDDEPLLQPFRRPSKLKDEKQNAVAAEGSGSVHAIPNAALAATPANSTSTLPLLRQRRYTLPSTDYGSIHSTYRTSSGRKKRSTSSTVQSFFAFTEAEAAWRKWLYATYVYVCMAFIVLVGVRPYISYHALEGQEPIGWALGYMFGNLNWFRIEVIKANLESWICLPARFEPLSTTPSITGWVEHLRQTALGPANTRLLVSAYWLCIVITGLAIVLRLTSIYEVDTRRKVFHFMMVAMLLPCTYIDPCFTALALSLVLALFLILDLFRASQLPPLSKPLARFLTPYVDGRDLRGPVVISHIFLLIGCAIPLWLSLAAIPRISDATACWNGWEVDRRDVSLVSGVICVGVGDAAASLTGRRYGRHKWFFGGGKSLEGSAAFASAVAAALIAAKAWLRIGGWPSNNDDRWMITMPKAGLAATMASLTEAVLTGGNDNVVVPVVLWACVKGLDI